MTKSLLHTGLVALLIWAAPVVAQTVAAQEGELRLRIEAAPGAPLAGALAALVDSANLVLTESLTSRTGHVTLRANPGTYRVRVRRIGYELYLSSPVEIPRAEELHIIVATPRVVLTTVVVNARAECGPISPEAATLASVWEEIAKALRLSQLTARDVSNLGETTLYSRELGPRGSVISADTTRLPVTRGRPFAAIDPGSLVDNGYVRGNEFVGWEYFGPDETVLLSDGFARTHCFRVVRDAARTGQLGVAFDPARGRRTADIRGVLWVDDKTSELREIVFRYVNAGLVTRFESGGFTRFRRMQSGAWIVSEWLLRMPKLESRSRTRHDIFLAGYFERGGSVDDR